MIIDKDHLKKVGLGYFEHMMFAFSVSKRLLLGSVFFLIHGTIPTVQFEEHNMEAMIEYLRKLHEERSK